MQLQLRFQDAPDAVDIQGSAPGHHAAVVGRGGLNADVRKLRDALTPAGFERLDSIFYATVDELGALHIQGHGQSPQLVDTMVEVGA